MHIGLERVNEIIRLQSTEIGVSNYTKDIQPSLNMSDGINNALLGKEERKSSE